MTQPLQNLTSGKEWWLLGEPALGIINMALQLISYDVALFFFCNLSTQRKLSGDLCMRFKREWKEKGVRQSVFPSMASEE